MQGLSEPHREALRDVAFVPVANATRLVAPCCLFARLKEDLAPFAYEVPAHFTQHLPVLVELGARDEPSAADLLLILQVRAVGTCKLTLESKSAFLGDTLSFSNAHL